MRLEILSRVEQLGGSIFLEGEKLKARFPQGCSEANGLLEELRAHREEIMHLLRQHQVVLEGWKVRFSDPFHQSAVATLDQIRALPWRIGLRDWLKETDRELYERLFVAVPQALDDLWGRAPLTMFQTVLNEWQELQRRAFALWERQGRPELPRS